MQNVREKDHIENRVEWAIYQQIDGRFKIKIKIDSLKKCSRYRDIIPS
jgi:hypothetical protein